MAATAPGGSGNSGANGANSAGSDSATDGLGNAADSVADAIGQAAEAVADAVASALSSVNDAAGLSDALGQIGSMLGIDAKDLQGIVGAALIGAIIGGVPGAIAAVANGLIGGTISEAARDAVSTSGMPASMQPGQCRDQQFRQRRARRAVVWQPAGGARHARQRCADQRPHAAGERSRRRGAFGHRPRRCRAQHVRWPRARRFRQRGRAASAFDGVLGSQFAQGREIVGEVASAFANGNGAYPNGGRGDFGDAVENLALSAGRLIAGQ